MWEATCLGKWHICCYSMYISCILNVYPTYIPGIFNIFQYILSFEFGPVVSESRALQRQSPKPLPGLPSRSSWMMQDDARSRIRVAICYHALQLRLPDLPATAISCNSERKQHVLSICMNSVRRKSRGNHEEITRQNWMQFRSRRVTVQSLQVCSQAKAAAGMPGVPGEWSAKSARFCRICADAFSQAKAPVCICESCQGHFRDYFWSTFAKSLRQHVVWFPPRPQEFWEFAHWRLGGKRCLRQMIQIVYRNISKHIKNKVFTCTSTDRIDTTWYDTSDAVSGLVSSSCQGRTKQLLPASAIACVAFEKELKSLHGYLTRGH